MKRWLYLIIGAGLLVLLSWLKPSQNSKDVQLVNVAQAEIGDINSHIMASGNLVYDGQVQIRPEVSGRVSELFVEEGDIVTKGQKLMTLDPKEFKADLENVKAVMKREQIVIERHTVNIKSLERRFKRVQSLFEDELINKERYEEVANELDLARLDLQVSQQVLRQAKANLAKAEDRLSKTVFESPIDGMVTELNVKVGETVIMGTINVIGSSLMTVADPSTMFTEVEVGEADIAKVAIGQRVSIYAASDQDVALSGAVHTIATTARIAQGRRDLTFTVKVILDSVKDNIRPGMSCRAEIHSASIQSVVKVPVEAVLYDEKDEAKKPYLFVYKDDKSERREVSLGLSTDTEQQLLEGVEAGEQIIIGPARRLLHMRDGQRVGVAEDDEGEQDDAA